jgi:Ca2+-binding RTX toxin-like protein
MAEIKGNNKNNTLDGTEDDDDILGKDGNDKLNGLGGSDYLVGGDGNDRLTGGEGPDSFIFNEKLGKNNVDRILDLDVSEDVLQLSTKYFKGMGFGSVKEEYVVFGNKAKDKDDHIIISADKEAFFYDADGKGGKDQVASLRSTKGSSWPSRRSTPFTGCCSSPLFEASPLNPSFAPAHA